MVQNEGVGALVQISKRFQAVTAEHWGKCKAF